MKYIDNGDLKDKKILVRVDFNVSFNDDGSISNDERIQQTLPTLKYLLENNNTLILMSHLGNPKSRDGKFSLKPVAERLQSYFPDYSIKLVDNYVEEYVNVEPNTKTIYLLENLRFYPGEKANDQEFARKLASFAHFYVNDAFAACHRTHASVVGVPQYLPAYCGFLLKKEIEYISKAINKPQKPVVAILGGAKISSKLKLIGRFIEIADHTILAGGLANNFLLAQGKQIGQSIAEYDQVEQTKELQNQASKNNSELVLPIDAVIQTGEIKDIEEITAEDKILDVGPKSQALNNELIMNAKTIIWNGPLGMFEDPKFRGGTDAIYNAITANLQAVSVAGGGDTLAAIAGKENRDKITHISTGGGAMLEFIEKGSLPGIDVLN